METRPLLALTGATGFLGKTVIPVLMEHFRIRALVRRSGVLSDPGIEECVGDLADRSALSRLCAGAFSVLHCAGAIKAPSRKHFFETNVLGTQTLVEEAVLAGVERFILISSLAAQSPHVSDYAWSKREAECVFLASCAAMTPIILRPPAIYGPGDRATLELFRQLSHPVAFLPASRKQTLSLIHVDDVARGILAIGLHFSELSSALGAKENPIVSIDDRGNGGGRMGYRWHDLCAIASRVTHRRVRPFFLPRWMMLSVACILEVHSHLFGGTPLISRDKIGELYHEDWVCSGPHLSELLAWSPALRFEEGFLQTLEWYRSHGWLS